MWRTQGFKDGIYWSCCTKSFRVVILRGSERNNLRHNGQCYWWWFISAKTSCGKSVELSVKIPK